MISENDTKIMSLGVERRNLVNKISSLDEKKFIEISKKIETSFKEVQEKYNELGSVASPVVENKYLWGLIKTTDIEKSLDGLLAIIQGLAKCTLGAFKANGENLEAILELMKILVSIENDLYKQLEDSDCSKENIANLLHDLCSQYNIDSNAIEGLFEQSFNRTITLRTRINDLREEVFDHISKYEEKFEHLDEIIQKKEEEFTSYFDSKVAEYNNQLDIHIKECLILIDSYKKELDVIRNSYKNDIQLVKSFLVSSINQYNAEVSKRHNIRFEQYERESLELKIQVGTLNQDISKIQNRLRFVFIFSCITALIAVISLIF